MTGATPPLLDLSLYLVTDTARCQQHGLATTVRAAVRGGATVVQVRDRDVDDREFVALGQLVRSALRGTNVPLIVNDRVHLAARIGADGVHLGQGDTDPGEARAMVGETAYLGLSVSTVAEVEAARSHPSGTIDYLGVGPVWPTGTKPDHAEPVGPDGAAVVVAASPWPCVLIGGINTVRVPELVRSGADGIAVASAVCGATDVAAAARDLRARWRART